MLEYKRKKGEFEKVVELGIKIFIPSSLRITYFFQVLFTETDCYKFSICKTFDS